MLHESLDPSDVTLFSDNPSACEDILDLSSPTSSQQLSDSDPLAAKLIEMADPNTSEVEPGGVNHSEQAAPTQPVEGVQVEEQQPLRVLVFDTQSTCSQLFSRNLSSYLRLGQIHHPYVIAATLGPERIHTKIGNEQTRRLWAGRASAAPAKVNSTRYEDATTNLLRHADRLEKRVCSDRRLF